MIQARMQEEIDELRAAIEQAQGLAEKVSAKGTLLEQTLRRVLREELERAS